MTVPGDRETALRQSAGWIAVGVAAVVGGRQFYGYGVSDYYEPVPSQCLLAHPLAGNLVRLAASTGRCYLRVTPDDLLPLADILDPGRRLIAVLPRGPLRLPPGGAHWYAVHEIGSPDPGTFLPTFAGFSGGPKRWRTGHSSFRTSW